MVLKGIGSNRSTDLNKTDGVSRNTGIRSRTFDGVSATSTQFKSFNENDYSHY